MYACAHVIHKTQAEILVLSHSLVCPMSFSLLSMSGFTQRMSWSIIQQRLRDTEAMDRSKRKAFHSFITPIFRIGLQAPSLGKNLMELHTLISVGSSA